MAGFTGHLHMFQIFSKQVCKATDRIIPHPKYPAYNNISTNIPPLFRHLLTNTNYISGDNSIFDRSLRCTQNFLVDSDSTHMKLKLRSREEDMGKQ